MIVSLSLLGLMLSLANLLQSIRISNLSDREIVVLAQEAKPRLTECDEARLREYCHLFNDALVAIGNRYNDFVEGGWIVHIGYCALFLSLLCVSLFKDKKKREDGGRE